MNLKEAKQNNKLSQFIKERRKENACQSQELLYKQPTFQSNFDGPVSRNFVSSESRRPSHVRKATLISVALVRRDLQCESLPARAAIGGVS